MYHGFDESQDEMTHTCAHHQRVELSLQRPHLGWVSIKPMFVRLFIEFENDGRITSKSGELEEAVAANVSCCFPIQIFPSILGTCQRIN